MFVYLAKDTITARMWITKNLWKMVILDLSAMRMPFVNIKTKRTGDMTVTAQYGSHMRPVKAAGLQGKTK